MEHNFKVGDRVRIVAPEMGNSFLVGLMGTVCSIPKDSEAVGVAHDHSPYELHDCDGACARGLGFWYFHPDRQLEKIDAVSVQIDTLDGLI